MGKSWRRTNRELIQRFEETMLRPLFLIVGIAMLAVGIGVGSHRVSVTDHGFTATCGTAYEPQSADADTPGSGNDLQTQKSVDLDGQCKNVAGLWQVSAYGLTTLGAVLILSGLFIRNNNRAS